MLDIGLSGGKSGCRRNVERVSWDWDSECTSVSVKSVDTIIKLENTEFFGLLFPEINEVVVRVR